MSDLVPDSPGARSELLAGRHRDAGGVNWASGLIRAAASTVPLQCEFRSTSPSSPDDWSVELLVRDRPVVLVDIEVDGRLMSPSIGWRSGLHDAGEASLATRCCSSPGLGQAPSASRPTTIRLRMSLSGSGNWSPLASSMRRAS
ncbi:MAG: hypothetical protein ACSLE8_14170 [Rhodococcus sp. (in: high G+C Gram-positive bacteria)]